MLEILIASIIGCIKPKNETLFGPKRKFVKDKILRSKRVKKATLIRIKIKIKIIFIKVKILKEL